MKIQSIQTNSYNNNIHFNGRKNPMKCVNKYVDLLGNYVEIWGKNDLKETKIFYKRRNKIAKRILSLKNGNTLCKTYRPNGSIAYSALYNRKGIKLEQAFFDYKGKIISYFKDFI